MAIPDDHQSENPEFDPDFSSPREIAAYYRFKNLNPIPAKGKRPAVDWKDYQNILVPQAVFEGWYNPESGTHKANGNVGTLLGRGKFMVDLDTYKPGGEAAQAWWDGLMAVHNNRQELETWEQVTGGGGRQLFFECPPTWRPPNVTTKIFVDVKGDGGFAVLPPSLHDASKKLYKWRVGRSPDDIPIMVAPQWLCDEIDRLDREQGGGKRPPFEGNGQQQHGTYNEWGRQYDGREDRLTRFVWGVCCDWRRECPIKPTLEEQRAKAHEKYAIWESLVEPKTVDPSKTKTQLLDDENRGPKEFWAKFQRAMDQWDGKLREEADKPSPKQEEPQPEPKIDPATGKPLPLILTSSQFLAGFVPPDYLIDGMVQRGYLYALTARTGHGKTAVAMLMLATVGRGAVFHGHETKHGNALFLAGENSQDVRARYQVLASNEGFDAEKISCYFIDGVIDLAASMAKIKDEAAKIGDLVLIIVDTAQAYFRGDDVNNNAQQGQFAQLLRVLTRLPGSPTVIVNCHPVKNAAQDNLVPMGGSHFLNEIDGNLTLWTEEKTCVLAHHPAKWRGSPFEQLEFELRSAVSDTVKDTKGRHMSSVVAVPITEQGAERRGAVAEADEDAIMGLIHTHKTASMSEIAKKAGFVLPDGRPYKSKVQRIIERLKASKLIFKYRGSKYKLTKKGCKAAGVKWEKEDDDD